MAWPADQPYRFRYLPQRDYLRHPAAAVLLLTQLLPPESLDWLTTDAAALSTLLNCLNGQYQFDEMQAHQLLIPCEDKAIWYCRIEANGGWSSELTLLRFSPSLIWEDPQQRPATFSGTVTPIAEVQNATETVIATDITVEQPSPQPEQNDTALSGEAFWQWLVRNVQAQHLEVNEPNARIHTVAGSVFLVTPGIFKLWLSACGQNVPEEYWREVQKKFQNLNLHRKQKTASTSGTAPLSAHAVVHV